MLRWWSRAVNRCSLLSFAAFRTPFSPWDTRFPLCVGCMCDGTMFSFVCALPSSASAEGRPSLFGCFTSTTAQSDFSSACMSAVRLVAFVHRYQIIANHVVQPTGHSITLRFSVNLLLLLQITCASVRWISTNIRGRLSKAPDLSGI
jgi:hypothetical protein